MNQQVQHLAIIMDGNRRWAKAQGLQAWLGHRKGTQAVEAAVNCCLTMGIPHLSLYVFSLENFKRSRLEQEYLFDLLVSKAQERLEDFIKKGVRIRFIGDRALFPESVRVTCQQIEERSAHNKQLCVDLLFCYGGQQEIVAGVQAIVQDVQAGIVESSAITPELFAHYLWNHGAPEPDLIVRTGGKQRLSNFLLFQSAYSEIRFVDTFWPDVTEPVITEWVTTFNQVERNFGA